MSKSKLNDMEDENWDDPSIQDFELMQRYAFVTQRAIDHNFVGYCYREYSDIKIDSGWRFIYGDEDEDYLDNPDNVITQDLSDIVDWKPELKDLLTQKPGSEFEWNPETESFDRI
ncbi:DUF2185 domain-containing protein [Dysgonomonas sp. 216]|uniref:immunity protein Imm33 domain-containing protein n=1 Tax=Dysgonomonas sp. 216 TaxID=2302934 RepID=UPI0013D3049B|nr:DUF2185 domain-containing protein [Dysgonomonas sp. 216]NDW17845.1 DUF2185 domain-containing protein [Dysgonomonas sp. 216]